ncbi:hypothetical protein FHL15_004285 [Xylaria flabelliformis]|uniref:Uncharacterized protein n=1 Tax=Xylaria flabelliformis TaxID=2512241 RepID=A0A553I3P4_9PEZI|nr:hypothetical protein FHL15_004285 [Xylaria flabelliformis]
MRLWVTNLAGSEGRDFVGSWKATEVGCAVAGSRYFTAEWFDFRNHGSRRERVERGFSGKAFRNKWARRRETEKLAGNVVGSSRCAVAGRWRRSTKDVKSQVDKRQTYESAADAGQICERKDGDEEYGDKGKASQRKKKTSSDDDETHKTRTRQEGEKGNCLKRRSPPDSRRTTPTIRGKAISHNDVGDGRGGKGKRSKQKMAMGSKVFKYLHQLRGGSQAMWLVRAVSLPAYVR